jgi:preprotein translocase subunit YajC
VLGSIATLAPLAAASSSGGSAGALLIPLVLMGVVFYFLLIRPQQRRQRQQRELLQSVEIGDEILTIGGIYGAVREIEDDELVVEIAPGVEIRILRSAVARKLVYDDDEDDVADGHQDHEEKEAGDQS